MNVLSTERLASALRRSGIGVRPLDWRVPPIETYPAVVAFVQTPAGRLVMFGLFAALMQPLGGHLWLVLTTAAALVSLAGRHRHHAVLLCTGVVLALAPDWFDFRAVEKAVQEEGVSGAVHAGYLRAGTLIACAPLAAAALHLAGRFREHPLGRRPLVAEHLLYFCLLGLATSDLLEGLPRIVLWSLTAVFSAYFWFLAYALIERRQQQPPGLAFQLATFHAFFAGPVVVPVGKGASSWQRVEARTPEELAVTQLKGLKLLAWAFFLAVVLWVFRRLVYRKLGILPLDSAFERFLADHDAPLPLGLLSIVANFPEQVLILAVGGHVVVAVARLAGFRLLRNTWRPLSSRTIAEFWNRYYYYFKEIMVHVYFYPTYVRCFKRHPRLRIACATFMAAGVGNFSFHFFLNTHLISQYGLFQTLIGGQTYALYCLLLAGGIVLSQLRGRRPSRTGWLRGRLLPASGVWLFYCFLSFFDGPERHVAVTDHFAFLVKVLGVDRWM
jgi:hypothetical protein